MAEQENPAVRLLTEQRDFHLREAEKISRAIEELTGTRSGVSPSPQTSLRFNFTHHTKLRGAVEQYLSSIKRPANLGEILKAMQDGGAFLGNRPDRYLRTLKICIRMNANGQGEDLWKYDDHTGIVELKPSHQPARK